MEKLLQGLPEPQLELPGYFPLLLWATSKGSRKSGTVLAMNLQALNCHQVMKGRKRLTNKWHRLDYGWHTEGFADLYIQSLLGFLLEKLQAWQNKEQGKNGVLTCWGPFLRGYQHTPMSVLVCHVTSKAEQEFQGNKQGIPAVLSHICDS